MWSEQGWVNVTARQAAAQHPGGTVSAHSGLFMCELCGQFVTLTDGYERERHFRHSAQEANKNCPERTFGPSFRSPNEHDLPIKLILKDNSSFRLELGLICVPQDILDKQTVKEIIIKTPAEQFTYSFERLNEGTITYVSVGGVPFDEYSLSVSDELSSYWPQKVKGVSRNGSLFDKRTGKLLPVDADVCIGKKYYLLTTSSIRGEHGINLSLICQQQLRWPTWRVYEIEPNELNEEAAKFFLNIHYRLTDSPLEMELIWPAHVETPYVIKSNEMEMLFHFSGGRRFETKSFPHARIAKNGRVIKVFCNSRQQLISAGISNVLEYTYIWQDPLSDVFPEPDVSVQDGQGQTAGQGTQNTLPANGFLQIEAPFDGVILLLRNEFVVDKIPLPAKELIVVRKINFGLSIQITQGLDVVWSCTFEIPKAEKVDDDELLYSKLISFKGNEISVNHRTGGLAIRFREYPLVKKWLRGIIDKGHAPANAIKYLKLCAGKLK